MSYTYYFCNLERLYFIISSMKFYLSPFFEAISKIEKWFEVKDGEGSEPEEYK